MSTLVESLKRLYLTGKVNVARLDTMFAEGKITQAEYSYITAQ